MRYANAAWAILIILSLSGEGRAEEALLAKGLYEVSFRLELPHLERYAVDQATTVCVDENRLRSDAIPLPLFSQLKIFKMCRIENVQKDSAGFGYDITCAGRGSARATAAYTLGSEEFRGRIAIVQGGKNMTMTEVQRGRRLGACATEITERNLTRRD